MLWFWFSIGLTSKWTGKDKKPVEKAEFFDIVAWKKSAEAITEFCHKGQEVIIEGRLCFDTWEDKEKAKHRKTYITAKSIYFGRVPKPKTDAEDTSPQGEADANQDDGPDPVGIDDLDNPLHQVSE